MKKWLSLIVVLLAIPMVAFAASYPDFTQIVRDRGPAVVNITTTEIMHANSAQDDPLLGMMPPFMHPPQMNDGGNVPVHSGGSGFIISNDGYILTNAHVVDDAQEVDVKLTDKREFRAKVIGADKRSDIALLKIPATGLPVAPIGNPKQLQVGEWVLAIGSPFGFENSVTAGIVSAKDRSLPDDNYVPFIQTDAAVNPGNSGGPLFNMKGEVVGINSQIFSRSGGYMGVSFAIPIDVAMQVANQLKQYGKVYRGKLGVVIQDVSAHTAAAFGLSRATGALIAQVDPDGPAARAGIKPGDVILKYNGQSIDHSIDLPSMVAQTRPGTVVQLEMWRNHAPLTVSAKLAEMNDSKAAKPVHADTSGKIGHPDKLGLVVADNHGSAGGVVVQRSSGFAAQTGIQPGDVILAVGENKVRNVAEYHAQVDAALKQHFIALLVRRDNETIYVTIETD